MSATVISVEHLSKAYRLGQIGTGTLSYDLKLWWAKMRGKPNPLLKIGQTDLGNREGEMIWALKDINFQVEQGEVLGIIGRNGAGKSTLLKILSRVTAPTSGKIKVRGRIASLLEVGTGFHPDLTGRENIFLNGAILGMSKKEIQRKFDEIVSFSEIKQFIDTPVKRYSSGMYVRLAFAVAAHLESDILMVDEVLAVGDAEFQKKCLGKIGSVAHEGRTVFFVSHNLTAIENLCPRTIYLDKGKIIEDGSTQQTIHNYHSVTIKDDARVNLQDFIDRSGTGQVKIVEVEFLNISNQQCSFVRMGERLIIRLKVCSNDGPQRIALQMLIYTEDGILVTTIRSNHMGIDLGLVTEKTRSFDLVIDSVSLMPRTYFISPCVSNASEKMDYDFVKYAAKFTVEASDILGTGANHNSRDGIVFIRSCWKKVESK